MDQASFLIAALRAAGIPARYRQGTLSVADAQTLLASMFIERPGVAGYLPDDAATADPLNDRELLALAQEHWWVEAYLPGQGWTDLDPSFADAAVGQSFAAPGSHDRIAEIPDALRHKLTLELTVERFNSFPIGGANLSTFVPLTGTFPVAQLAAKSLILGHIVETKDLGGLVFGTVEHTYTPYFGVNGDEFVLVGDSFQDLLTNFPLASQFTTAEWITISIEDIAGNSQTFTREVKDIIGQATRLLGGASPEFALDADTPFITFGDSFVINTLPHHLRQFHLLERQQTRFYYDLLAAARLVDMLPRSGDYTPEEEELSGEAFLRQEQARALLFALTGLEFARLADPVSDAMPENLGVKFYYDLPRLIVMQGTGEGESGRRTMDLRNTEARAVVLPGQSVAAAPAAQWIKAVAESRYEGLALLEATGPEAITAERIFAAAQTQGIEFVYITPDKFDLLDLYLPDPNGYGYAAAALIAGREVLIPQAPVLIDGEPRLGWWEIDPASGTAVSVLDDGTHGAATEYGKMIKKVVSEVKKAWDKAGKKVYELWTCIAENVVPALNGGTGNAVMGGGCAVAAAD
jgi:large repetitive protein